MATTFRLKRKIFALSNANIQAIEALKDTKGHKQAYQQYAKLGGQRTKALEEYNKAAQKWIEEQTKAGNKNATMAAYAKGEGAGALENLKKLNKQEMEAGTKVLAKKHGANTAAVMQNNTQRAIGQSQVKGVKGAGTWMRNTWRSGPGGKAGLIAGGAALVATPFIVGRATAKNKQQ